MKREELQTALQIRDSRVPLTDLLQEDAFRAQIVEQFYGGAGIELEDAVQVADLNPDKIVITGSASFPPLKERGEAQAECELVGDGVEKTLRVTLRYKLPEAWQFPDSFPELPLLSDDGAEETPENFQLRNCYFYLTTHDHEVKSDVFGNIALEKGLNFVGHCAPAGMNGLVTRLVSDAAGDLVMLGTIVPGVSSALPALKDDELPWDARPRIPGIHLQVPLGSGLAFPPGNDALIKFTRLRLETYSPLGWDWPAEHPAYEPAMAYTGDLEIGGTSVLSASALAFRGQDDTLAFTCRFDRGMTLDNLLKALRSGADDYSMLPEPLRNVVGSLGPQNASITLTRASGESGYEVGSTQVTVGMGPNAAAWRLFEGLEIAFESLRIAVAKPFDSKQRSVLATIRGSAKFLGLELQAEIQAPDLYISAYQRGTATVDLSYFQRQGVHIPDVLNGNFKIANIALVAQPGSFYSFSMNTEPGTAWKIDDKYSFPSLRFGITCRTPRQGGTDLECRFDARTKQGEKAVPVFLLARKLAGQTGIPMPELPAAMEGFTVESLELSYKSQGQDFRFEGWGRIPLDGLALDCGFTIDKTPKQMAFGGKLLLVPDGRAPLAFSLNFGAGDDSKYCLAAYSDLYGYKLNIQSLARSVFSRSLADLIPASFVVSLRSALFAYSQEAKNTAVLFGVDLGARINLSDLPLIGKALPANFTIGLESLRVIVASGSFSQASVKSLNSLLLEGVIPLPDESQKATGKDALKKGFTVSAVLLIGNTPQELSLPAGTGRPAADVTTGVGTAPDAAGSQPLAGTVTSESTKWFEIEKSLGPLTIRRLGLTYEAPKVGIKFDASLQLGVLTFTLEGLGLRYALSSSTEPLQILKNLEFTLDGAGLALGSGPIEIGGSLVRVPGPNLQLDGALLIRAASFSFTAFGSYTDLNGTVSVMAFAVLLMELGDPTGTGAFVVTGLAFGFGVNRTLRLPVIEEVEKYPLVQAAMGKQGLAQAQQLQTRLREYVAPSAGNFWVAAGIRFNSFGLVDSFLLLSVSWGAEIEIGLLGLSRMTVPPLVQPEDSIAGAELALRGVIRIVEGSIKFEARLTDNSFMFSKSCRLTGGFAFCVWFAGPHAGDFVISLGGYHPAFVRPAHYPLVPRLGMRLQIGDELSITGEAYFALTPSCLMAGGKLCAVFKSGGIEAWFIAYADFLMNWQPFYYQAAMGITIGIALRLGSLTLLLELSVELKLQGPPFGGEARVNLWIISFTIPFGTPASPVQPLTASEFVTKCLPAPAASGKNAKSEVISVRITKGLLREQKIDEHQTQRIVNAHELSLSAQSVVPSTEFEGLAKKVNGSAPCGIRPMGKTAIHSTFSVTSAGIEIDKHVRVTAIRANLPDAVWGKSEGEGIVLLPKTPETKTIDATVGIQIVSIPQEPEHKLPLMPIAEFTAESIPKKVNWGVPEGMAAYKVPGAGTTIFSTIWSDSVIRTRSEVLACLRAQLPADRTLNEPNLEHLSKNRDYFQAAPEMHAVGS